MATVRMRHEWLALLGDEFEQPHMRSLSAFLRARKQAGAVIYPGGADIFSALEATPPEQVKVVVLGQDPYHGAGQAHGLSFSVRKAQPIPPSLRNIFQELQRDIGIHPPDHGDLSAWAQQGVLLLNSVLTVEAGQAGSHQGQGWEQFTDRVVAELNAHEQPKVFLLWGAHAAKKGKGIDRERHLVLTAPHPSPLSAHRGFIGCGHFSAANAYLAQHGLTPIDWQLPVL